MPSIKWEDPESDESNATGLAGMVIERSFADWKEESLSLVHGANVGEGVTQYGELQT